MEVKVGEDYLNNKRRARAVFVIMVLIALANYKIENLLSTVFSTVGAVISFVFFILFTWILGRDRNKF